MSVIRVNFVTDFYYGDPAVVVTLDGLGVDEMLAAVQSAVSKVSSVLEHEGVVQPRARPAQIARGFPVGVPAKVAVSALAAPGPSTQRPGWPVAS